MIHRYSSLQLKKQGTDLLETFLNKRLVDAIAYDRIAGYFSLSILEIAGEQLAHIPKVRMVCNSHISLQDVTAGREISWNLFKQSIWNEWCNAGIIDRNVPKNLLEALYLYLHTGRLEVRILPEERFGLIHGKAGVITFRDQTKTSFMGSANESVNGWKLNYELVWEDSSHDAVGWVENEFAELWGDSYAIPLSKEIIEEIQRTANRQVVSIKDWKINKQAEPASVIVESPVYRKQNGLWSHQKYFVQKVFSDHKLYGGARYLLADQVGLGKTLQLAMAAQLIALLGDKPILIIAPKTLLLQWQDELLNLLEVPSAIWNGKVWIDENGVHYENRGASGIKYCPRKIGIISQGLITGLSASVNLLLQSEYDCVILDEAHRARRSGFPKIDDTDYSRPVDASNLYKFMLSISKKTKTLLLATATPVQIHPVEAWDLLYLLNQNYNRVLGNEFSEWMKPARAIEATLSPESMHLNQMEYWQWIRNPLPPANEMTRENLYDFESIRDSLNLPADKSEAGLDDFAKLMPNDIHRLEDIRGTFFQDHNPFIRHIIQRTREYLETTIDPDTKRPVLEKVEVELYGEKDEESLELGAYQSQAYTLAQDYCKELAKNKRGTGFLETLLLRRIGSSMEAGYKTSLKLLHGNSVASNESDLYEIEEDEEEIFHNKASLGAEAGILQNIIKILETNRTTDPKLDKVYEILTRGVAGSEPWMKRGCIVFSSFYDTAYWMAMEISKKIPEETIGLYAGSNKSVIIKDGLVNRTERETIKTKVKNKEISILIGTDAASEGLNLQTLGSLINLDLPWNPTKLEQRKGRIQRIGQKYSKIFLYNLRYKDSVEDRVHQKLSERLESIRDLFGQIPDTLEDIWVEEALGEEEKVEKQIRQTTERHPFAIKYNRNTRLIQNQFDKCFDVLNNIERSQILSKGWVDKG